MVSITSLVCIRASVHGIHPVTSSNPTSVSPNSWEESTGLLSSLIPAVEGGANSAHKGAHAFNLSKGDLKLGPAPISEDLRTEAERVLREQGLVDRDPSASYEVQMPKQATLPGIVSPTETDLLPHPPLFKTMDVNREVEKVRDARKRIKLDPAALNGVDLDSPGAAAAKARSLPSICAYTLHDAMEGYVSLFTTSPALLTISQCPVHDLFTGLYVIGRWNGGQLYSVMEPEGREASRAEE